MSRILRPAAILAVLIASLFALAACGGDDKGSDDSYKQDAKAVVLSVRAAGTQVGNVMSNADTTSDAALTQQLDALQKQTAAVLTSIEALKPPSDADQKLVEALKTAFAKVNTDIGKIADAATANDPTGARSATEQLVADSPAVKVANNALGTSVGVPPAPTVTTAK